MRLYRRATRDGNPRQLTSEAPGHAPYGLDQIESIFNRLKSGGLGVQGPARARVRAFETVSALISLALLGMTALQLADERKQKNIALNPLPPLAPPASAAAPAPSTPMIPLPQPASAPVIPLKPAAGSAHPTSPQQPASSPLIRRRLPAAAMVIVNATPTKRGAAGRGRRASQQRA